MREPEVKIGSWDFHRVKLEDKFMYDEFIKNSAWPVNLWSSNFAYIWAYGHWPMRQLLWKIVDGCLVTFIFAYRKKLSLFCLPFGNGDLKQLVGILHKCMKYCSDWNRTRGYRARIRTINEAQLKWLQQSSDFENLFIPVSAKSNELHYSVKALLSLKGKEFSSLRKTVNKYYREYPNIVLRHYQPKDHYKLLAFNTCWEDTAGAKYSSIIDRVYFRKMVKHYKELNMVVIVAEQGKEIVGVNIGGILPTGEGWGCICKTKKVIAGLSEAITLEFIKELSNQHKGFKYLNVGSDMGEDGLKRFKQKFRPALDLERYRIYLKEK